MPDGFEDTEKLGRRGSLHVLPDDEQVHGHMFR